MIENPVANKTMEGKEADSFIKEVLKDFWICCLSREASLLARKDVLTGKGKFGITGDGKEVPQVAMARAFKNGDHRSGYYRDQTFMFALGLSTVEAFFAQLYADAENDPFSGGRQMNSHFATPYLDEKGDFTNQKDLKNISAGISSTGGQMARGFGLALSSKLYRNNPTLNNSTPYSDNGNEVSFLTIGDASTSEGVFWESINAACVMQVPMAVSVWDDGYGISVPIKYQTTKQSISKALKGFEFEEGEGMDIYVVNGWDYPALCQMYEEGIEKVRRTHTPALFHVNELTQPQGHSTSGSHERYKSKDRLEWEREHDCIKVMRKWIIDTNLSTEEEVAELEKNAKSYAKECRDRAWADYMEPATNAKNELAAIYQEIISAIPHNTKAQSLHQKFEKLMSPLWYEIVKSAQQLQFALVKENTPLKEKLSNWIEAQKAIADTRYHTNLYSEGALSALKVPVVPPTYSEDSSVKTGFNVLNTYFDKLFERDERVYAYGELSLIHI